MGCAERQQFSKLSQPPSQPPTSPYPIPPTSIKTSNSFFSITEMWSNLSGFNQNCIFSTLTEKIELPLVWPTWLMLTLKTSSWKTWKISLLHFGVLLQIVHTKLGKETSGRDIMDQCMVWSKSIWNSILMNIQNRNLLHPSKTPIQIPNDSIDDDANTHSSLEFGYHYRHLINFTIASSHRNWIVFGILRDS